MLVQYTPVSSLTEAEKLQLRVMMNRMVLEGRTYIDFFGKYLLVNELLALKRTWESIAPVTGRQTLLG
jgi:hypothetical protein